MTDENTAKEGLDECSCCELVRPLNTDGLCDECVQEKIEAEVAK